MATGGSNGGGGGVRSGGGVLLNVETLSGEGTIAANGTGGGSWRNGGGGSGGRAVAIYFGTNTFDLSSNATGYRMRTYHRAKTGLGQRERSPIGSKRPWSGSVGDQ